MKKIYINCPFDTDYENYLQAIIFVLIYNNYEPILCENPSSGNSRISHICEVIKSTRYSIHDLSRYFQKSEKAIIPKFNMPLELGLDLGYINFAKRVKKKSMLICVEDKKYFNRIISDLGGHDIEEYNGKVEILIRKVRDWLYKISSNAESKIQIPSASILYQKFLDFIDDYERLHLKKGRVKSDLDKMLKIELIHDIQEWIASNKAKFEVK